MSNTTTKITHIHLKKEENTIQVYLVDNRNKTEERVSLLPQEMHLSFNLSRAIMFVKNPHVELLKEANLVDQVISAELDGITSVVLDGIIHKHFDMVEDIFFELDGKEAGVL